MFCNPSDLIPTITDQGVQDLIKLAEIVCNSHYGFADSTVKEDLQQVGLLKALEWLHDNDFDPTRSSLKNVLYTAMRNEMKNFMYRNTKDTPTDDDVLIGANVGTSSIEADMTFPSISEVPFRRLTEEQRIEILESLAYMGFVTPYEKKRHTKGGIERWMSLTIWKNLRK